jgi:hypothetical protein
MGDGGIPVSIGAAVTAGLRVLRAPVATNPRLQGALSELFRAQDRVPGGTAGALKYEKLTGELLSRTGHEIKARQRIGQLRSIRDREELDPADRRLLDDLLHDLQHALDYGS